MPKPLTCTCGTCRTCKHRVYMREYLRRHPEKNDKSAWRQANRETLNTKARIRRAAVPQQVKYAQDRVAKAIKAGTLIRPERCERCDRECKPHAHHDDYAKPLEVEWLCGRCHAREHSPYD